MTRSRRPAGLVLVIAGSDPSGGAGLELDLKVLALHGVHGAAVASCATLQSARGLERIWPADLRRAKLELDRLRADTRISAIKIGMLPDREWVEFVARQLGRWRGIPVVLDPVLAPSLGRAAPGRGVAHALRTRLLSRVDLVTPNAGEAAALLGIPRSAVGRDPGATARELVAAGARAVLLKGGHLDEGSRRIDRLRGAFGDLDFSVRRDPKPSPRGTGCALSSAIAARLALAIPAAIAVAEAIDWLRAARRRSRSMGEGRRYLGLTAGIGRLGPSARFDR